MLLLPVLPPLQTRNLKRKNDKDLRRKIPSFSESFEDTVFNGLSNSLNSFSIKNPGRRIILLALSGGADSTAMAAALAAVVENAADTLSANLKLHALHVNHGIRPSNACTADKEAAVTLCKTLDIPITVTKIPPGTVNSYARQYGTGIEGAARYYRYKALEEEALRVGADAIVTAHTSDDRLETILMSFLRGSGPAGLGALSSLIATAENAIPIVRPLLPISRAEVLAYLKVRNLGYCSDETNNDQHFFRNRIRHVLIPLLDQQFPYWRYPVLRLGETQAMTASFLLEEAEKRLAWDNQAAETGLQLSADQFFAEPAIIREEALFLALDILTKNDNDRKNPRRDTLRSFAQGIETAVDLGQTRLENKNGWITARKTTRQTVERGFSVLIKRTGAYKLNDITVIAGEQQTDSNESVFYAGFPLVFRSAGEGKILAEDRNGRAAEARNGKLVWKREQTPKNGNIRFSILFNGGSFTNGS